MFYSLCSGPNNASMFYAREKDIRLTTCQFHTKIKYVLPQVAAVGKESIVMQAIEN